MGSVEELYSVATSSLKRCQRRLCGRRTDDRTFVCLKLLMRYGARREFLEHAAVSQRMYLGLKAQSPLSDLVTLTSTSFYTSVISELRAWSSVMKLVSEKWSSD